MGTRTALPPIPEKAWMTQVVDLARLLGWAVYHTHDSRRSAAGFPDLVLCRPPRLLLVELKRDGKRPTPAQEWWLDLLRRCPGVEVHCWRPADLDAVAAVLR